jgi:hypothetical protein
MLSHPTKPDAGKHQHGCGIRRLFTFSSVNLRYFGFDHPSDWNRTRPLFTSHSPRGHWFSPIFGSRQWSLSPASAMARLNDYAAPAESIDVCECASYL